VMPTKWNPNDKHPEITLTNNNLTAIMSTVSERSVRSTTAKTTGKWYFECTAIWRGSGTRFVGIMLSTATLADNIGFDSSGYGLQFVASQWRVWFNNGATAIGGAVVLDIPATVGVCVDLDNNFLYFTQDGANISGDPVALTGGLAITAGTWYAATGGILIGGVATVTTRFGATGFSYTPPAPFSAWDTSPFTYQSFDTSTVSITSVSQPVGS
jgi:hypothetical protein